MLKLLIAEDEHLALDMLSSMEWESIGVAVVGKAENGKEALALAKSVKPDIIISDIRMPEMDGLALAETITNLLPDTKFIILSAYNEFEYAQRAVNCGVFEYILKPYTADELLNVAERAVADIMVQRQKDEFVEGLMNRLEFSKYFFLNYFLNSLSSGVLNDDFNYMFGNYGNSGKYIAAVVSFSGVDAADAYQTTYKLFLDVIKTIGKKTSDVTSFFDVTAFTFIFNFDREVSDTAANSVVLDITNSMLKYLDFASEFDYTIGVGTCVSASAEIPLSYRLALNALKYSFYVGTKTVICISDVETNSSAYNYQFIYEDSFFDSVKVGNTDVAMGIIDRLFALFRNNHESIDVVQRICHNIIVNLSICLMQCNLKPDMLFDKTDVWSLVRRYTEIDRLEEFIKNTVDVVISKIVSDRADKSNNLIQGVKEYIAAYPMRSLTDIAEHFHLSPNYLSGIFSRETETTIKNYIIQERINHAKEMLLNTNKTIFEIANEVGYTTPQYFGVVFKKVTGQTPSAYKNSGGRGAEPK